jgi:hypothetical protein
LIQPPIPDMHFCDVITKNKIYFFYFGERHTKAPPLVTPLNFGKKFTEWFPKTKYTNIVVMYIVVAKKKGAET